MCGKPPRTLPSTYAGGAVAEENCKQTCKFHRKFTNRRVHKAPSPPCIVRLVAKQTLSGKNSEMLCVPVRRIAQHELIDMASTTISISTRSGPFVTPDKVTHIRMLPDGSANNPARSVVMTLVQRPTTSGTSSLGTVTQQHHKNRLLRRHMGPLSIRANQHGCDINFSLLLFNQV